MSRHESSGFASPPRRPIQQNPNATRQVSIASNAATAVSTRVSHVPSKSQSCPFVLKTNPWTSETTTKPMKIQMTFMTGSTPLAAGRKIRSSRAVSTLARQYGQRPWLGTAVLSQRQHVRSGGAMPASRQEGGRRVRDERSSGSSSAQSSASPGSSGGLIGFVLFLALAPQGRGLLLVRDGRRQPCDQR